MTKKTIEYDFPAPCVCHTTPARRVRSFIACHVVSTARLTASTWWYFAITFHVFAPSVSKRTKLRMTSRNAAGENTPRMSVSSCERPFICAGSIVFHSAKCSAAVVTVPTRALSRSETPITST